MKKIYIVILLYITMFGVSCHAQDKGCNLFGEKYTYIKFDVEKEGGNVIHFAVVTTTDTIDVNLSDFDSMVKGVCSKCEYMSLSPSSFTEAFNAVFGDTPKTRSIQQRFVTDFFVQIAKTEETSFEFSIQTGEKVHVGYFDILGVFYRVDKSLKSSLSTELPEYLMTVDDIVVPVSMADFAPSKMAPDGKRILYFNPIIN